MRNYIHIIQYDKRNEILPKERSPERENLMNADFDEVIFTLSSEDLLKMPYLSVLK